MRGRSIPKSSYLAYTTKSFVVQNDIHLVYNIIRSILQAVLVYHSRIIHYASKNVIIVEEKDITGSTPVKKITGGKA